MKLKQDLEFNFIKHKVISIEIMGEERRNLSQGIEFDNRSFGTDGGTEKREKGLWIGA